MKKILLFILTATLFGCQKNDYYAFYFADWSIDLVDSLEQGDDAFANMLNTENYISISSDTAERYFSAISEGQHFIRITGEISKDFIAGISKIMRDKPEPEIYLDLSKTTGLIYCPNADSGFNNVNCLVGIITPESLQAIGNFTFSNCKKLKYVILNDGLQFIGSLAFAKTTAPKINNAIKSVNIPSSVTWIGIGAFQGVIRSAIELTSSDRWYYTNDYANFITKKGGEKIEQLTTKNLTIGISIDDTYYYKYYFYKK